MPGAKFSLSVKAATPKLRLSCIVAPEQARDFEQKLTAVMSQAIFKSSPADKKKQKQKKPTDAKQVTKREKGGIKKCRKDRRKDLMKAQRKSNRAKMLAEKKLNREA